MKKYAAIAAIVVALGVSGCGVVDVQPKTWQTGEASTVAAPAGTVRAGIVEHVQNHWIGPNVPDAHWIETTALITCKHAIGGRVMPDVIGGVYGERNSELVTAAALKLACPEV